MLRPFLQTKYSPETPHSESKFQTPRGTISALKKGHWYIKEIKSNFVNNQCFHVFHLQVCFLVVPCPSIPAPQTSETDYGDDYGDYDASVKVLKDLHIATFNDYCWLLIIFFSSPCRVQQVVQATDLRICWRWELESLKALWPSSTTRWTFSSFELLNFLTAIFNNKVNFLVSLLSDKVMVYTIHKQ